MTIYEALKARLNREPTRAEVKAEVQRILDESLTVKTGAKPLLDERRLIDGAWHAWCGDGWIAECYSEYVHWPAQLDKHPYVR